MRGDNRGDEEWFQRSNEVDEGFEERQRETKKVDGRNKGRMGEKKRSAIEVGEG